MLAETAGIAIATRQTDSEVSLAESESDQWSQVVEHPAQPRAWRYLVLHHSGTPVGSVASIDEEHRSRSDSEGRHWLGIGYHFVIGNGRGMPDGEVQATFRWREQRAGAHAGVSEYNDAGIGICLIGDFTHQPPSPRQLAACEGLIAELRRQYQLPRAGVIRHSDVKPTECPGQHFPFEALATGSQQRRLGSLRGAGSMVTRGL